MAVVAKTKRREKVSLKDKIMKYKNLKEMMKSIDDEITNLKNEIINELGIDFDGKIDGMRVSIKEMITYRIDSKKLKDEYPEVAVKVEKPVRMIKLSVR